MNGAQANTQSRVLDAAERLFAEQGFEGASIRAIVDAANVNLAAVHYHFKSKEALLEAVLLRRISDDRGQTRGVLLGIRGASSAHSASFPSLGSTGDALPGMPCRGCPPTSA